MHCIILHLCLSSIRFCMSTKRYVSVNYRPTEGRSWWRGRLYSSHRKTYFFYNEKRRKTRNEWFERKNKIKRQDRFSERKRREIGLTRGQEGRRGEGERWAWSWRGRCAWSWRGRCALSCARREVCKEVERCFQRNRLDSRRVWR